MMMMNSMSKEQKANYNSIEQTADPEETASKNGDDDATAEHLFGGAGMRRILVALTLSLVALIVTVFASSWIGGGGVAQREAEDALSTFDSSSSDSIPMPSGVNLGSWLSLEDYFFASSSAKEVATPFGRTQAQCLPPLHTGRWQSETDLLSKISTEHDASLATAIRVFHAHRLSFVDLDQDFARLSQAGVPHVRVPLSWCLTDLDPANVTEENAHLYTCVDPFYTDVRWPAVPRSLIVSLLRACARHGLTATLDVHTYPGATSIGTFSGLWPRWPRFWDNDDVGRKLWKEFVTWIESLAVTDPLALQGLRALSPMNEPAHLAGLFPPGDPQSFLPPLPEDAARQFRQELSAVHLDGHLDRLHHPRNLTEVPDGPHLRVLLWLRDAIAVFRESSLPTVLGKELHVNVHESVLLPEFTEGDASDPGGRQPHATRILAAWWRGVTTHEERATWAALDMHHYHAWGPACSGTIDGSNGNYTCGDAAATADALRRCTGWAAVFRAAVDAECGRGAKLVSAEFSAATYHQVRHACNDVTTLRASYVAQVEAARRAGVELFYWSYRMPYGGAFRAAWSFRQLMYLLGVFAEPDTPQFDCGEHQAWPDEPSDDTFAT